MTTVLVTKDFILADRKVVLNSLARERKKLIVTKKFVIFSGPQYLDHHARKQLTALVRDYVNGKIEDVEFVKAHNALAPGNELVVITRFINIRIEGYMLSVISDDGLVVPIDFGSGGILALTAYFAGVDAKKITDFVSSIDCQTSSRFDIVYRNELEYIEC